MKYDEKVDIFSLGICLSELATGLPIKVTLKLSYRLIACPEFKYW